MWRAVGDFEEEIGGGKDLRWSLLRVRRGEVQAQVGSYPGARCGLISAVSRWHQIAKMNLERRVWWLDFTLVWMEWHFCAFQNFEVIAHSHFFLPRHGILQG